MSAATHHGPTPYYFVPSPSRHPAMAALGLFFVIIFAFVLQSPIVLLSLFFQDLGGYPASRRVYIPCCLQRPLPR